MVLAEVRAIFIGEISPTLWLECRRAIMQILKAGVLYFAFVFGAGFVLGAICTLWVVRRE